jgi:hypothetical protein
MIEFKNILLKNIGKMEKRDKRENKEKSINNKEILINDYIDENFYIKYDFKMTDIEIEFKEFLDSEAISFLNKDGKYSINDFIKENSHEYSVIRDEIIKYYENKDKDNDNEKDDVNYSDEEQETEI